LRSLHLTIPNVTEFIYLLVSYSLQSKDLVVEGKELFSGGHLNLSVIPCNFLANNELQHLAG